MKMKAFVIVALAVVCIFAATQAHAQGGLKLLVNAGGVVPTGDLKDIAGAGFAANVYLVYTLSDKFGIEGHVGYHKFASEEVAPGVDVSGAFIPIKVGVVKLWGASRRFYTNPSVGIYSGASDFDGSEFGLGPRIGYLFPLGDGAATLDIGAEFHNIFSDPENSRYFGVGVSAVFNLSGE